MRALILAAAIPLMAQVPKSYHGTSNGWDPFHWDKTQHALIGSSIGFVAFQTADWLGYKSPWWHAIFWAAAAALWKENYDRHHGGRPEWADVTYTVGGAVAISIPLARSRNHLRLEFATAPKLTEP